MIITPCADEKDRALMEPAGQTLATALREARVAASLTQMDLAQRIGLRQIVSISRWENGASLPEPRVLARLIGALALDADRTWEMWGGAYAARARHRVEDADTATG